MSTGTRKVLPLRVGHLEILEVQEALRDDPVPSLARRLAVEKDGARPADAHDLPRRDLHQVPVLGVGRYGLAAQVAVFLLGGGLGRLLFSDSSRANRRSAEKAEKLLSPAILPSAHRARRDDLYRAVFAHEQRDGLQVQLRGVVQRSPRPTRVVAPPATGAREIRHPQLTLLQRSAAAGTHITVGIEVARQFQE